MREPAFDVYEIQGRLVVEVALPGVLETDIDVTIEKDRLWIRAERLSVQGVWVHREIERGELSRVIPLPGPVEILDSQFEDGLLRLWLRRRDA